MRSVAETRHAVTGKARVENFAIVKADRFIQRAAQPHHNGAFVLVLQVIRIDDRATLEGLDDPDHLDLSGHTVRRDFGAGRHVSAFLKSAGDPEAVAGRRFVGAPAEGLGRLLQNGAQPRVF